MPKLQILNFRPAEISDRKTLRVYFYALHPQTNKLKRVVVKCNRLRTRRTNLAYARRIRDEINMKLYAGWNPFIDQAHATEYVTMDMAVKRFLAEKEREVRPYTYAQYNMQCNLLLDWLRTCRSVNYYVVAFSEHDAVAFMDKLYTINGITACSYNSYRQFYVAFFNWMVDHRYCKKNVFECIKRKKREAKQRGLIEKASRQSIAEYLRENDYPMLCVCQLMFSCLLRPKEILMTRIKDIDLAKQTIFVPGEVAKNHHDRTVTIPDALVELLRGLHLEKYKPEFYAFAHMLKPGPRMLKSSALSCRWAKVRKALGLSSKEKLYSFRDSGITEDLRAGIPAIMVRDHADHSSLEITNIYTKHANPELHRIIKEKSAEF